MAKEFYLTLAACDVFQILDALFIRETAWTLTAARLKYAASDDATEMAGGSRPDECGQIAAHYREITLKIRKQIDSQWSVNGICPMPPS